MMFSYVPNIGELIQYPTYDFNERTRAGKPKKKYHSGIVQKYRLTNEWGYMVTLWNMDENKVVEVTYTDCRKFPKSGREEVQK